MPQRVTHIQDELRCFIGGDGPVHAVVTALGAIGDR